MSRVESGRPMGMVGTFIKKRSDLDEMLAMPNPEGAYIEKSKAMGKFWDHGRTELDVSIWDAADELHLSPAVLRGIELGSKPDIWTGPFPINYGDVLKQPQLYPEFCETFGIEPFVPDVAPQPNQYPF